MKNLTLEKIEEDIKQWCIRHGYIVKGEAWFTLNIRSSYKNKYAEVYVRATDEEYTYQADTLQDLYLDMYSYYGNLCDSCSKCIATCSERPLFGNGIGDDNVINCIGWRKK